MLDEKRTVGAGHAFAETRGDVHARNGETVGVGDHPPQEGAPHAHHSRLLGWLLDPDGEREVAGGGQIERVVATAPVDHGHPVRSGRGDRLPVHLDDRAGKRMAVVVDDGHREGGGSGAREPHGPGDPGEGEHHEPAQLHAASHGERESTWGRTLVDNGRKAIAPLYGH